MRSRAREERQHKPGRSQMDHRKAVGKVREENEPKNT